MITWERVVHSKNRLVRHRNIRARVKSDSGLWIFQFAELSATLVENNIVRQQKVTDQIV